MIYTYLWFPQLYFTKGSKFSEQNRSTFPFGQTLPRKLEQTGDIFERAEPSKCLWVLSCNRDACKSNTAAACGEIHFAYMCIPGAEINFFPPPSATVEAGYKILLTTQIFFKPATSENYVVNITITKTLFQTDSNRKFQFKTHQLTLGLFFRNVELKNVRGCVVFFHAC